MPNHIVAPVQVAEVSRLILTAESARGTQPSSMATFYELCFDAEASTYLQPGAPFAEE